MVELLLKILRTPSISNKFQFVQNISKWVGKQLTITPPQIEEYLDTLFESKQYEQPEANVGFNYDIDQQEPDIPLDDDDTETDDEQDVGF